MIDRGKKKIFASINMPLKISALTKFLLLVIFFSTSFIGPLFSENKNPADLEKMQKIYFYARRFYDQGKYSQSIDEFNKILAINPQHGESLRMIALCKEKLSLTQDKINQGINTYNTGDIQSALEIFKDIHKKYPDNYQVRSWIATILMELSFESNITGDSKSSLRYLKEAKKMTPDNKDIDKLYDINMASLNAAPETTSQEKEKTLQDMLVLFEEFKKEQRDIVKTYLKDREGMYAQFSRQSEEQVLKIKKLINARRIEIEKLVSLQKKSNLNFLAIISGIVLLLLILFIYLNSKLKNMGDLMISQQKRILGVIFKQNDVLKSGKALLDSGTDQETITIEEMLYSPNSRIRARGVEILETELADQNPELAERILSPFLKDPDNRVRANACKVLYAFNPAQALSIIKEMAVSSDKWMRISAAWLMGELKAVQGLKYLIMLAQDKDKHVMKRALISLTNLKELLKEAVPETSLHKIENFLNAHSKYIEKYKKQINSKVIYTDIGSLKSKNRSHKET